MKWGRGSGHDQNPGQLGRPRILFEFDLTDQSKG